MCSGIDRAKYCIGDIPISFSIEDIEKVVWETDYDLRTRITMERIRHPQGKLTSWISGRKFCFGWKFRKVIYRGNFKKNVIGPLKQVGLCATKELNKIPHLSNISITPLPSTPTSAPSSHGLLGLTVRTASRYQSFLIPVWTRVGPLL